MNKNEFKIARIEMIKRHKKELTDLIVDFAKGQSPVKIGDIITGIDTTIKVSHIQVSITENPCCIYSGVWLTKKGVENKRNEKAIIYQTGVIKINGVPYELQ